MDLSAPVAPYFADKDMAAVNEMAVPPEKADFSAHAEGEVVDEEIREFFLWEFNELVENLNRLMPQWRANPQDKTLTTDVRRAFHTLKGSGRTVGYQFLGEFAWQNERLLNGVNEGLFKNNELIQDVINDSLDLLNILQKQEDFSEPAGGLLAQATVAEKVRDELAENPDQNQESLHRLAHQYRLGGSAPQSSSGDSVDFHLDDETPAPAAGSASLTAAPAGKDLSALAEEFSVEIAASKAARGEGSKLSASLGGQNNEADHSALNFALDGEARGESLSVGAAPTGPTAHNFQSIVEAIRTAGPAAFDVGSPAFDTLGAVISSRLENHAALQDSRIRRQIAEQLTEALDDLPPLPIVEQLLERVAKQITHFGDTPNGLSIAEDNPLFSTDVIGGALDRPAPIGAEQLREIEAKIRAELSQQPSGASPEQLAELEAKIRSELATSPASISPEQLAEIEAKVRAELSAEPATASAEQLAEIEAKIRADIAAQNAELLQRQLAEAPERRLSPSERAEIEAQIRSELTAQSTALLSQQVSQSAGVSAEQLAAIQAAVKAGDDVQLRALLEPLAAAGNVRAQYNLGVMHNQGLGGPQNSALAEYWWLQAAAQDHPEACYNLGVWAAENGDYGRARHHYEQAPDHADALANLGALLAEGRGGAVAEARARDCWQRAAAQRQALAALKLAEEHRARAEAEAPLPDPFENLRVYRAPAPRPPEAAAHYRRAYHYYQIAGPVAVARLQASGIGDAPNGFMAFHDWEATAAADDSDPRVQWGRRHPPPLGPPVENIPAAYEAARQYYEARARRAVVEAQYELASLYARGIYVEPDWRRARAWFERSARAGWPAAQYELARCCAAGLGGPRDLARAQLYYGKAAGHN